MRENSGSLDLNFISLPSPAADKNWVSWLSSAAVFVFWKWCLILRLFQSCKLSVNRNSSTTLSFVCDICVMLKSYDTAKYSSCVQASIWIFSLLCPISGGKPCIQKHPVVQKLQYCWVTAMNLLLHTPWHGNTNLHWCMQKKRLNKA